MKQKILNLVRGIAGTRRLLEDTGRLKQSIRDSRYEARRFQLIEHILHDSESGVTDQHYTDHDIIVSLTTYGKRIQDVAFTIESIMQQSMKANRIVLWLDYSFEKQRLPQSLLNQQKRGLEIRYCKDIRSYTKLVPSLRSFPDAAIITVDDDLLYDYDLLEHLINAYLDKPQFIHACRVHRIVLNSHGKPIPYLQWKWKYAETGTNTMNFLTGVGGVLYPPGCLDAEVLNEEVFLDICKYADDVWFYAMALKKGTLVNKVRTRDVGSEDYILNDAVQDMGLSMVNTRGEMLNDSQIKAVFTRYGLYDKLK